MAEDDTTQVYRTDDPAGGAKPMMDESKGQHSSLFNVSIRGWIAIGLTATVCGMSWSNITVVEPLYSMATLALGFYFGQKTSKP
jgi:hypothetical protein